ncbi:MAG: hypothetical protein LUD72_07860, partial [Bacteroidales bacterium]|nr:hypothetical protein [Bacteroidales bacterium]
VKESPEYAFSIEDSKSNAEKLRETIEECFSKGYLRKIWPRINDVKELIGRFDGDEKEGNWIKESLLGIDVAFDLLARSNDGNRYREFAFLQLFVPIERYVKDSNIIRKMGDCFYICKGKGLGYKIAWKVDNGSNYSNKYKSAISFVGGKYVFKTDNVSEKVCGETNFRVSSILIYKFGKENSSCHKWTEIYEKRNKIAHGEKCEILDEDFEKIIGFMNFFFDTYTDNVRWRDSPENLPNYAEQLAGAGFFVKTSRKGGR